MNYTKMKFGLKKGIVGVCILGAILLFTTPLLAQTNGKSGKGLYELFSTKLPDGAQSTFFIFLLVKFVSGVSYICKPSKSLCLNPKEKVWIRNY